MSEKQSVAFLSGELELVARRFFADCKWLGVTPSIAEAAGIWWRDYGASHDLDMADVLVVATAEHHGLAFAALNLKHFPMLKGLKRAY